MNKCNNNDLSPIYIAAQNGHASCITLLVSCGGDVNKFENNGISPIFIAACNGHADCLKALLVSRADPRSSWKGTSALDIALQKNHTECVCVLEASLV